MTLAVRLKQARLKKKLTQEELAETVGIKQQAVQRIEAGKVKSTSYVVQLAKALDVTPEWLALGEDQTIQIDDTRQPHSTSPTIFASVPLLKWDQVDLVQQLPLHQQEIKMLPVFGEVSAQCFALQVKDNSMVNKNGENISFLKEDYIIVDTSRSPRHNDYIIAKLPDSTQMTFRQLLIDGTERHLKALNTQYNTITLSDAIRICGVVILRYNVVTN